MRKNNKNKSHLRKYKRRVLKEILLISSIDIEKKALYIPPMKSDDKLFVESVNPHNPRLMPSSIDNELYYEYGYLGTTIFLLNIIEFGKSYLHKDSYIYPALFCFRQYIENMIKIISKKYDTNVEFESRSHDLMKFWKVLLNYIDSSEDVRNVESIIHELQESDKHATAFRYPGALNAAYSQNQNLFSMLIDIKEMKTRVLQVYAFFDGLYEEACRK